MSSWRLPRPVVGAKRIRRRSSAGPGGSKPLASEPTPASHPTLPTQYSLLPTAGRTTQIPLPPSPSLSLSLAAPKNEKQRGGKNLVTARRGRSGAARTMSAAGEGGKEKGPGGACELCGAAARVYCGADEATLCWGCDAQVHGANFLVARHARALLCRGCSRPTPWRAAGPRLGPTASLCDRCVRRGGPGGVGVGAAGADEDMADGGEVDDGGEDEDEDEDDVDQDDVDEEGEGENQVVPWTEEAEATPPPVASSTSSSSRGIAANGVNAAECAKEDVPCSTSQPSLCHYSSSAAGHGGRSDEATSSRNGDRFLASRHRKRSPSDFRNSGSAQAGSGAPARNCSNVGIGRNGFT
ncbi:hypothetical protein BS78_07G063800 [Paspalum vaginatum]|nr:hypothetical protein BS78_07G063800 [Paspalum vaginatum]